MLMIIFNLNQGVFFIMILYHTEHTKCILYVYILIQVILAIQDEHESLAELHFFINFLIN